MKFIKLFMLLAVVSVFAACSSDDDYNTNEPTVSFASDAITTKESAGIINIPIKVTGLRNGSVNVTVKAEEVGANPAKEDVNYLITSKNINLNADDAETATMNVEIKIVDDDEINENRTFKLTIINANGAQIGDKASTTITIRDNDAAFYEKFFGKWTLSGTMENSEGATSFSKNVTISGETDENAPDYDNILTVNAPALFNVGADLDCEWHFHYGFNKETKQGTLGFICKETVATYASAYQWVWVNYNDIENPSFDEVTTTWSLGDNDAFPTEITFPENCTVGFYQPGQGPWLFIYNLKLTKK